MTARLEAADPAVWARTLDALAELNDLAAHVAIRCDRCRTRLACLYRTTYGPLSVSWWEEPATSSGGNLVCIIDGDRVTPARMLDAIAATGTTVRESGPAGHSETATGVATLLALPPDLCPDYPDLVVRCDRHGDAILDRTDALAWTRSRTPSDWLVKVAFPRLDYERVANDIPDHRRRTATARWERAPDERVAAFFADSGIDPPGVSA